MTAKMKNNILAMLTAVLMIFAMMPMASLPVYAEDEIPEYTVTLESGLSGVAPITVSSKEPGMLAAEPKDQGHGMFYWDNMFDYDMSYCYPDLPESFNDPDLTFIGWTSTLVDNVYDPGFKLLFDETNNHVTLTAQWKVTVSFDPNGGSDSMDDDLIDVHGFCTVPECTLTPPEGKIFWGWNTVAVGTSGTWYHPGDTVQFSANTTLYARWNEPNLSLCSYDKTNSISGQGGKFIFKEEEGYSGGDWSYGCDNYTVATGNKYTVTAAPDNGYKFIGWYNGEYLTSSDDQDARPYLDQAPVTTDRAYTFTVTDNTVLCPVFEKEPLVNFVDIGTVWTKLDPVNATPFTGEVHDEVEGLTDFIELTEETWTSTDGDVLTSNDRTRIPIVGKTYKYAAVIKAKGSNVFDPVNGFRFIYGGHEYSFADLDVTFSADNKTATISGFIPDQTVEAVDLKTAKISGIVNKTYNGKKQTQNPVVKMEVNGTKNVPLEKGIDYEVKYLNNTNVGTATVQIIGKGIYKGTATASFKILPKKAVVSKAAPGKKSLKVTMKVKPSATGGTTYQIQYRVKGQSKWKTTVTTSKTKTIKKLKKGKRYQIRVRAYKVVKGTKYYGAWSKVTTTKKIK